MINFTIRGAALAAALSAFALPLAAATVETSPQGEPMMVVSQPGMAVRNDVDAPNQRIVVRVRDLPAPGFCRLWWPGQDAATQPAMSGCDVTVPRGAILLLG